jgi:Putative Flp pilus-assembly TadE/G-like
MTRVLRRLHTEERGSVIIFVVGFLPVALAIAAFVIDGANLFEHRRHLQMQADAGALAGAQEFQHCFIDAAAANDAIEAAAMSYSGDDYNAQIGASDAQDRVEQRINAASWTEDSFTDGEPCDTGYVDVKLTETDSPGFFPLTGDNDVRAHARVQVFVIRRSNKLLPIAVPDPDPKVARAFFVNEALPSTDPNYVIASVPLTRNGSSNGLAIWDNSGANPGGDGLAVPKAVPITADHVGVRIALGGNTSTTCGELLVDCYDSLSTHGLVHIQGWNAAGTGAPKTPLLRSVTLTPGTCPDAYFADVTASCGVGVTANVDFGASPTVLQATLTAHVGGVDLPMSYNAVTATWTSTGTGGVPAQAGPQDVTFNWEIQKNADGTNCSPTPTCRGNFAAAQRVFSATPDRSGPVSLAQVTDTATSAPANSLERCGAVQTSCTHDLVVKIGIKGGLALSDLDDPPVRLRVIGGSQNQSLDCDPALSNLKDELAGGCKPAYTPYTGTEPCPAAPATLWAIPNPPNAWECVAVQTGNATNQVAAGLNTRILGTDKPTSCPPARQNHWPNYQAGDPRIVFVLVTPFGAFTGSGSTTVPVMRFAAFYITGWTGQGGGFDNPCLTQGDELPTNPAEIVGRFIKYVDVPNEGGTGEEECDFSAIEPCAAVLVE